MDALGTPKWQCKVAFFIPEGLGLCQHGKKIHLAIPGFAVRRVWKNNWNRDAPENSQDNLTFGALHFYRWSSQKLWSLPSLLLRCRGSGGMQSLWAFPFWNKGGCFIPSRNAIPDAVLTEAVARLDYIGVKTEHLRSVRSAASVSTAMKDAVQDQMLLVAEEAGESLIKAVAKDLPVIKTIVAAGNKVMERFRARLAIRVVQWEDLAPQPSESVNGGFQMVMQALWWMKGFRPPCRSLCWLLRESHLTQSNLLLTVLTWPGPHGLHLFKQMLGRPAQSTTWKPTSNTHRRTKATMF